MKKTENPMARTMRLVCKVRPKRLRRKLIRAIVNIDALWTTYTTDTLTKLIKQD